MSHDGLHIALLSVHGLIRATELELGRDADTGGQTLYVVELARALAQHPQVAQVDLITRAIVDESVDPVYAQPREAICDGADIVRLACGGTGYLRKELLWDYLDEFGDNLIAHYQALEQRPHVVHSHYADAGLVGSRVAAVLQCSLLHTGHSLGRVKRRRLLASGLSSESIEQQYAIARRIVAEEQTLASAARVIASTHQEIDEQYGLYDFYRPDVMHVLPPGTNVSRFVPPQGGEKQTGIASAVRRFLKHPDKPMILSVSRADARKNIASLVHAFGQDKALRERANLVVVMGNRDDLTELGDGARDVLTELLQLIDRYDLYGKVAYPKHHSPDDVPVLYRLATLSLGVFVNPALTEPFGLTLLEAAASGLPIVATEDGGPRDIVENCSNGLLIDPLDTEGIGEAVSSVIGDWERWQRLSRAGLRGVRERYSWQAHAGSYVELVQQVLDNDPAPAPVLPDAQANYPDRMLITDLNRALIGDDEALAELVTLLKKRPKKLMFVVATGLREDAALRLLKQHGVPEPDVFITSSGTHITYAPTLTEDTGWSRHIEKAWTPQVVAPGAVRGAGPDLAPALAAEPVQGQLPLRPGERAAGRGALDRAVQGGAGGQRALLARPVPERGADPCVQGAGAALHHPPVRHRSGARAGHRRLGGRCGHDAWQDAGGGGRQPSARRAVLDRCRPARVLRAPPVRRRYSRGDGTLRFPRRLRGAGALGARAQRCRGRTRRVTRLLCTDLDRTLLPNGAALEPPGARRALGAHLAQHDVRLAYVTGRDIGRVHDAIERWALPVPDFVAADAGTTIVRVDGGAWSGDEAWAMLQRDHWGGRDGAAVHACLDGVDGLLAQPGDRQHRFKRSYTVLRDTQRARLRDAIEQRTRRQGLAVSMLFSHDPLSDETLLDLVSPLATKRGAVAHIARALSFEEHEVLFAGDSGNDLDALVSDFPAVLVGNADAETRRLVLQSLEAGARADRLHQAKAPYAAGIVEGLEHFAALYSKA